MEISAWEFGNKTMENMNLSEMFKESMSEISIL